MMTKQEKAKYLNEIQLKKFKGNNRQVLNILNLLCPGYVELETAKTLVINDMDESEFVDSVAYLTKIGYIETRESKSKKKANVSDCSFAALEAGLTAEGTRCLMGAVRDVCVESNYE